MTSIPRFTARSRSASVYFDPGHRGLGELGKRRPAKAPAMRSAKPALTLRCRSLLPRTPARPLQSRLAQLSTFPLRLVDDECSTAEVIGLIQVLFCRCCVLRVFRHSSKAPDSVLGYVFYCNRSRTADRPLRLRYSLMCMRLLPRDEQFYQLFLDHIDKAVQAAALLAEAADLGNGHLQSAAKRIQGLEQEGDEIIHEIYVRLNRTFITPIDPEDIHSLSSSLDDILDGIEDCIHRIVSYRVDSLPKTMAELCRIILKSVRTLERAFTALSRDAPLTEHCIEVNRLEQVADDMGRDAVSSLFQTETDCIRLIKLKEIYDILEATVDNCEDVADALQNVVVKNS